MILCPYCRSRFYPPNPTWWHIKNKKKVTCPVCKVTFTPTRKDRIEIEDVMI